MSSTSKKQVRVSRVADWAGWCTPCESEDRPLVLTRTGPGGLTSWLAGLGDEDRFLLLTCNVCGHWQVVPACEEDDPEVVLTEDALSDDEAVREDVHQVLAEARAVVLPAPRAELDVLPAVPVVPDLPAAPLVADLPASPVSIAEPAVLDLGDVFLEVPPVPAPACAVPAPRRAPEVAPALAPEAIAAASRLLSAARAQTQRTAPRSAAARPAPLDRSRRTRNAATSLRTDRPAPARAPRAAVPAVATSISLPAVTTSQVVLAVAS